MGAVFMLSCMLALTCFLFFIPIHYLIQHLIRCPPSYHFLCLLFLLLSSGIISVFIWSTSNRTSLSEDVLVKKSLSFCVKITSLFCPSLWNFFFFAGCSRLTVNLSQHLLLTCLRSLILKCQVVRYLIVVLWEYFSLWLFLNYSLFPWCSAFLLWCL